MSLLQPFVLLLLINNRRITYIINVYNIIICTIYHKSILQPCFYKMSCSIEKNSHTTVLIIMFFLNKINILYYKL